MSLGPKEAEQVFSKVLVVVLLFKSLNSVVVILFNWSVSFLLDQRWRKAENFVHVNVTSL